MSVTSELRIRVAAAGPDPRMLDALLASKWRALDDGFWCIPLNEDPSEWRRLAPSDRRGLSELFDAKVLAGETFGLRLWWEGGEVGGEFLVYSSGLVGFSASINRVMLNGRASDVSWYLPRILPIFGRDFDLAVESWEWIETA